MSKREIEKTMAKKLKNSGIITMVLLLAMGGVPAAESSAAYAVSVSDFKDVAPDYWGAPYIEFAAEKSIINGYPNADGSYQFLPEKSLTKEEAVTMLYRVLSAAGKLESTDDFTADFADTLTQYQIADWAKRYVAYALNYKLVSDAELNDFTDDSGAGLPAPRQQVAVWTAKAMDRALAPAYSLLYSDKDSISKDALPYVDLLYRQEIMRGDDTKMFHPAGGIKRSEFAAISKRVFELEENETYLMNRETQSFRGTIVSVDTYSQKIMMTQSDGTVRVIQLNPKTQIVIDGKVNYNGLAGIGTGTASIVAWGAFYNEGDSSGNSLQLQITTKTQTITGLLKKITEMGNQTSILEIENGDGDSVYYLLDAGSAVNGALKKGKEVTFITDGIKILELE